MHRMTGSGGGFAGRADELILTVLEANPTAIVINQSGQPNEMPWEPQAHTLVQAWLGGHRFYDQFERDPLFYFGYGLSYSTFEYSDLKVPTDFRLSTNYKMNITVDVKNSGPYRGAEVVQVYIRDPESSVQRPLRELETFSNVDLDVDGTKTVDLYLDKYSLFFWSEQVSKWKAEAGEYVVIVASSDRPQDEGMGANFHIPKSFYWTGL